MADKKPNYEADVSIEEQEGNPYTRADELLRQLQDRGGGFILIFDAPEREALGMISNLTHSAIIEVLQGMLEAAKLATN